MPSFADSIFLFVLALLLFGPKKLPVLARELGKWMGEFRRASNEFKMQMDEELRASEQADRQKQIAAMEAAAPIPPPLNDPAEPEHPHLRNRTIEPELSTATLETDVVPPDRHPERSAEREVEGPLYSAGIATDAQASPTTVSETPRQTPATADSTRPIPIATSGSLKMMPPATGLPTPRNTRPNAIPEAPANGTHAASESESIAHGD